MQRAEKFDAIVIGGGHNGLVCAAYLARAGQKVCVLERRHVLGGCATTEELWPGYKVSTAAYVISLFLPEIIRELKLREYGLKILPRSPSSFTPLPDGRSLTMGADLALCHREIAKFSMRDAVEYPRYNAFLERVAAVLEPVLSQSAPDPLPLPDEWRRIGMSKRLRDGKKLWALYRALGDLGADLPQAVELLTGAARPILDRWFESDILKATLATDAIIGAFLSISSPGSAYVLLHHVMGEAGGTRGVWGYVRGGMGGLAAALEKACHDLGVEIRRESPVRSILTDRGRAIGVRLEDGTQVDATCVASSVDAHLTFEKFLTADELPAYFRDAVARIDYSSASAKINLALAEPPRFTCSAHGRRRSAPSRHDAHRPVARISGAGVRRCEVRPAERAADPRNDHGHQRRSLDRPAGQTSAEHLCAVCALPVGRGELGRSQGAVRRSLYRDARGVCSECAGRDRASPGALAARPGANVRHHGRQHHAGRDECPSALSASAPWPAGPTTARRSAACICAARPATPAAACWRLWQERRGRNAAGPVERRFHHGVHGGHGEDKARTWGGNRSISPPDLHASLDTITLCLL